MNNPLKKIISCFLILAFLFNIVLPLQDSHAMTAPWWSGSQAYGSTNIAPPPPGLTNLTEHKNNQESGEPVLIHNGDFIYEHTDLLIPSRGMNTEIKRIYKSQSRYNNRFGYGWDMFYNKKIVPLCNGDLHYLNGKLNRWTFRYIDGINYISPQGIYDTIVQNPDGTFTLTEPHKTTYTFDQNGVLTQIKDRNLNTLSFTYDPQGKLPIIGKSVFSNDPNPKIIAYDYKLLTITDTVGRQISLGYDTNGRLTTITDFSGRVYSYSYDPSVNGDLLTWTTPPTPEYPQGLTTTYTYQDHNLSTITDAKNQTYLTNNYDSNDRVYQQDYGQGHFSFSYDSSTQTTVTDPKTFVTEWIYDPYGNPTSKKEFTQSLRPTDPPYYNTTYSYNNNLELTNTTYSEGNGIKYTFDESNSNQLSRANLLELRRKQDMSQPDYNQTDIYTTFTYEPNFNLIKTITDPKGHTTTFTYDYELPPQDPNYDTKGNLVKITYPQVNGSTPETLFTYNQYGQLETVTDPNNNTTKYEYYTQTGYLYKIIQDPGPPLHLNYTTEFSYDAVGNPLTIKNARGHTTTFEYNSLNQLTKTIASQPYNYETKYSYDENGNLKKLERQTNDPTNPWQTSEYTYTPLDQLETVRQYKDTVNYVLTTFSYDLNGNRSSITDPENHTTTYQYDERNLIWRTTEALNNTTEYSYDHNGNLEVIKDDRANSTTYAYDLFDRLERTTFANGSFKQFGYDKNSNLTTFTNPANQTITYAYDSLNRLDLKTYPDATTVDYGYDLGSRLTSIQNPVSNISYGYDAVNRISSATNTLNSQPYTMLYEYDEVGNRKKLTSPSGTVLDYTYDELNRLTTITQNQLMGIAKFSYDSLSRRTNLSLSQNQTSVNYTYDYLNRLTHLSNKLFRKYLSPIGIGFPGANLDFDYTYDNAGNRLTMKTKPGTSNYTYDNTYQLTDVTYPSGPPLNINYQLDSVGNREIVRVDGSPTTYTPNNLNQYSNVGGITYSYDLKGNLTNDGLNSYTYDYENRLISATGSGNNATYTYDGLGRRISKTVNNTTTYFVYDGDQIIEERDSGNQLTANYVYGSGIDELLKMRRNNKDYFYLYDGLGSVTAITDTKPKIVESYTYDIYGSPTIRNPLGQTIPNSAIGNRYMWTGREWDSETGLYHYRNRTYSPKIGRFLQRDPVTWAPDDIRVLNNEFPFPFVLPPIEETVTLIPVLSRIISNFGQKSPSLLHPFSYVSNNPINFIDPYGLTKNEKQWWEKACFGKRFWREFERRRVPGAQLFGVPTSLISGAFTIGFRYGTKGAVKAATGAATKGFESINLGKFGIYVRGYKPGWFTAAGAISKVAGALTVFYIGADIGTLIGTRISIGCEE